jgi:pyrroline-5-carboxylate reductase
MTVQLTVFGGGNMGAALLGGLVASGWAPAAELAVVEPLEARRLTLRDDFPGVAVGADPPAVTTGAVLAVKPVDIPAAAAAAGRAGATRVLSIAAGVPTATIEAVVGGDAAVVRAMPNTPALVGAGAAAISPGRHAGDADLDWAAGILGAVGTVVRVPEHLLDAVTGLSGSGPAYLFLVVEALVEGGVLAGLPRDVSAQLTTQLLVGTATLLARSGQSPEQLRAAVTSPGGTTAAGLHALERAGTRAAFLDAVVAATERSRQLGGQ